MKAIAIDGSAGQLGSILVTRATGIDIAAGVNDDVILRNLSINGFSSATNGISFTSGKTLRIQNLEIERFAQAFIPLANASAVTVQIMHPSHRTVQPGFR